jgi:hypothetical protein
LCSKTGFLHGSMVEAMWDLQIADFLARLDMAEAGVAWQGKVPQNDGSNS